jgi:hypothetical protein
MKLLIDHLYDVLFQRTSMKSSVVKWHMSMLHPLKKKGNDSYMKLNIFKKYIYFILKENNKK